MNCGGGVGGYIATADEERFVREYNGFLISITGTSKPGQFGFGLASAHQTSYGMRELGKDWTGNSVYLWAIANAVYMSLMGPEGFREVGTLILQRSHYAAKLLSAIDGVRVLFPSGFFKEFVINFDGTGLTPYTEADGDHTVRFSPDFKYYVDTWSRVDLAPVSELRRTEDKKLIMELERGDLVPLAAAGWRAPEPFTAAGRDGKTEIWGVIHKPRNFDPSKKYPVIEAIYAGPQGSFVPKTFSAFRRFADAHPRAACRLLEAILRETTRVGREALLDLDGRDVDRSRSDD